jgi:hypothetical protein
MPLVLWLLLMGLKAPARSVNGLLYQIAIQAAYTAESEMNDLAASGGELDPGEIKMRMPLGQQVRSKTGYTAVL